MLDTNICIYIVKNKPLSVINKFREYSIGDIYLSSITVSELFYGVYKSQHIEKNLKTLEKFLYPFEIVEFDLKASIEYGKIRASLEKQGKIIGGFDILIGAHCKSLNYTIVTNNVKEFKRIDNLNIENWVEK